MTIDRNTTGGLRWHLRAFWHRKRCRLTTELIADWLDGVQPVSRELLLIGGSAGWMMSSRWLQRFDRIVLIDIDPLAPTLFRWNHGRALNKSSTRLEFMQRDAMQDLEALLAEHPEATIFFDNVLGQHVYRVSEFERAENELSHIAQRLSGRDWGSVHDLLSGPVDSTKLPVKPVLSFDSVQLALGPSVAGEVGTALHTRLAAQVGGYGEWMDHATSGVFLPGADTRLIAWPFLPNYAHWLQAGWVSPTALIN